MKPGLLRAGWQFVFCLLRKHVGRVRGMMNANKLMLYAITDRRLYGANEAQARAKLLEQIALWAANGVAYIQLREKDMSSREQVELARAMMEIIRKSQKQSGTRLLINSRSDVALAAGADGVHLPAGPGGLTAEEVRKIFPAARFTQPPCISISCHTLPEVSFANQQKPDCILLLRSLRK